MIRAFPRPGLVNLRQRHAVPHLVEIYPAGSATPAITGNVVLSPNLSYSAVAIGDGVNQPLGLLALLDDTAPVSGSVKIRIGHLAPFAAGGAAADVRLQDGTPVITNVPYSLVSPYLTLPAGAYDLKITAPGGSPTLIDPLPVTLNSNDILSVFASGDGVNQKLGVFAWPSNQPGFFLPLMSTSICRSSAASLTRKFYPRLTNSGGCPASAVAVS
jgi:hypothetical protein